MNCYQLLHVFYLGSACLFVFFLFIISYLLQKQASKLINFITRANLESKQNKRAAHTRKTIYKQNISQNVLM